MPTYIALINWTQKGIENVKDSPDRADSWKDAVKMVPPCRPRTFGRKRTSAQTSREPPH